MNHRSVVWVAGWFGATGVAAGAFGAHALRPFLLAQGTLETWQTAVHYQLVHAVALLALAGWQRGESGVAAARRAAWAARCWTVGVILFSGSLYELAAGGPHWVGPVTPLGGLALIAGWLWLIAAAWTGMAA
jgi:uncharacterized membrane protein YgdD (TMEM256/DUF423 family)